MNKNILIVTPFFPPQTHAAVFRAFKLVKYLKRFGWNPIVLTVDTNYIYLEDENLLKEIADVPIYCAHYLEPTIRGIKMALGGRDTTYKVVVKQQKQVSQSTVIKPNANNSKSDASSKSLYKYILERWVQVPDRFRLWKGNAIKMGVDIIKKHDIGIVYTTCLPFTTNQIGLALKQKTGVKWVADFRDPITYAKRMYSDYAPVFAKQKKIEQDTFKYADAITGTSSAYLQIFDDLYTSKYTNKCYFIPTGVDDDYIPEMHIGNKDNSIVFVGEYLKEYKDYFLKIFAKAIHSDELRGKVCTLKIVGNEAINRAQAEPFIKNLGIEQNVQFINHLPQRELYNVIKNSKAAVLIPGATALWWTNFAKLVDYIALGMPVLAMVPMVSEARAELTKAGLGIFLDDESRAVTQIIDVFEDKYNLCGNEYAARYTASRQTKDFIAIFESVLSE